MFARRGACLPIARDQEGQPLMGTPVSQTPTSTRIQARPARPVPEIVSRPGDEVPLGADDRKVAVRLAALAVLAFLPVIACGWTNWDDDVNFTRNPDLRGLSWDRVDWAFRSKLFGLYEPLGRVMVQAEFSAFGTAPKGYHVVSLLLHAANTAALFALALAVLRRALPEVAAENPSAIRRSAALAVALWAVHPLRAEPVAWLSCQTYLPCVLLMTLCVLAYLRSQTDGEARRGPWFAASLLLFVAALMFKAVAVTVPAVLVLLDAYPLRQVGPGRWWRLGSWKVWLAKVPFVAVGLAYTAVLVGNRHMFPAPWSSRLATAAYGVWFYPARTLLPFGLSAVYPPCEDLWLSQPSSLLMLLGVVVVTAVLIRDWNKRPGLATVWLVYLATLAPSSGIVRTILALAADRYSYVSTAALFLLLGGAFARLSARGGKAARFGITSMACVLIVGLSCLSWGQAATWRSSLALWTQAVANGGERSALAQFNLAQSLSSVGRFDDAKIHYQKALELRPDAPTHNFYYGLALVNERRPAEAMPYFRTALRSNRDYAPARKFLGLALLKSQRALPEAQAELIGALMTDPTDPESHYFLGLVLVERGEPGAAVAEFAEALRLQPYYPEARTQLDALRPSSNEKTGAGRKKSLGS